MKRSNLLMTLLAFAVLFVSCDPDPIMVTSITLNETTKSLAPGETFQLSVAEVLPANADDKSVAWSSSNIAAATVSDEGLVTIPETAADMATATITATANDGSGKTATCAITVGHVKVTSIALNETAKSLAPGDTFQLSVTEILPADAANKNVTWSTSNAAAATVGNDGLVTIPVTAADTATATITATANDGSGKTAMCEITVAYVKVTSITLNATAKSLAPGNTFQLSVTEVLPANAADKSVTWSSSNTAAATVDNQGLVTIPGAAADAATATITATANDGSGKKATCAITVAHVKVTSITINATAKSLAPGNTFQLSVTDVQPADATNKTVTWSTSNANSATVDNNGLVTIPVTATEGATATITVTANDGSGKKATCAITVATVKVTSITLNATAKSLAPGNTFQLSVTDVQPADATNKTVTWSTSNANSATVDNNGLVTIPVTATEGATATITATANDGSGKTATCTITIAEYITINGVIWATTNVDAPGTFAASPESYGMFYQWNRLTAWSPEGAVPDWDKTNATGDSWESANDPCPTGWRVPTKAEFETLTDTANVTRVWETISSIKGYSFTDNISGQSIFLPAAGFRYNTGGPNGIGQYGSYWSSSIFSSTAAYYLYLASNSVQIINFARGFGMPVRCVLQ